MPFFLGECITMAEEDGCDGGGGGGAQWIYHRSTTIGIY